jgi:hypothetical protein
MKPGDLILVSVDDHLVEPSNLFSGRLPAQYAEAAPRVERLENGADVWMFNGTVIPNVGLNAVAGRPKDEYGVELTAFDEMRPGCFDVHERVKDMNAGGVLGSMCFPSFPGFSGRAVCRLPRQGSRPGRRSGLQRLAHRGVVWGLPWSIHPNGATCSVGRGCRGA